MKHVSGRKRIIRSLQITLFAIVVFALLSAEVCLPGGCGTTTIVDMENGQLVGKIWCDGVTPNGTRTNFYDSCVGVTSQSGLRIECGDQVVECPTHLATPAVPDSPWREFVSNRHR